MRDDIEALGERHGLPQDVLREIESLCTGTPSLAATVLESYVPVALETESFATSDVPLDSEPELIGGRYRDLGPLGMGGMGEVRRVRDVLLNRVLAMKTLHTRLLGHPAAIDRFLEEAQATGQLQHPGIVPIHDLGRLPDGRMWFTMKEVRGRTLREVLWDALPSSDAGTGPEGYALRRLVNAFMAVCQTIAYAHERGVVHRDLKPENVMVGAHGEVMVLDWGLAKLVGRPTRTWDDGPDEASEGLVLSGRQATRAGTVSGTPTYMPPEQARGEIDKLDARADVYALGAMLYEILSGRQPYLGDAKQVLVQVLKGPPPRLVGAQPESQLDPVLDGPGEAGGPPWELVAACERAMARDPGDRYPSARALGADVEAWLDGARRREQALEVVERARRLQAESEALVSRGRALRQESVALLEGVATWEPEERKSAGWARAEEAEAAEVEAELRQLDVEETLRAALQISAELPEAHAALAERHLARHREAEAVRSPVAKEEALLRHHAKRLPRNHPVRQQVVAYLRSDGELTLLTEPPGAEVTLYRLGERNRRRVEVAERVLGTTPLRSVKLPMGSYLCVLRHPDCEEVRYPVEVERNHHWDGVPPGETASSPVWLPPRGWLGEDEIYVPAGWFRSGGDPAVPSLPGRRLWCDSMVMHRFPVTNRQYLEFLNELVKAGREQEALQHAPRQLAATEGEQGALFYRYEAGRFALQVDGEGDAWLPDFPVLHVDWYGARAYLAWLASRTGRPWRLPAELEWEKAARGVDGRWFPWGDFLDPSWCCMTDSHRDRRLPAIVDSFPVDSSPYGVRGLGGNVADWCLDLFDVQTEVADMRVEPPDVEAYEGSRAHRVRRGGSWVSAEQYERSTHRQRYPPAIRYANQGFRGVYRVEPP